MVAKDLWWMPKKLTPTAFPINRKWIDHIVNHHHLRISYLDASYICFISIVSFSASFIYFEVMNTKIKQRLEVFVLVWEARHVTVFKMRSMVPTHLKTISCALCSTQPLFVVHVKGESVFLFTDQPHKKHIIYRIRWRKKNKIIIIIIK